MDFVCKICRKISHVRKSEELLCVTCLDNKKKLEKDYS